MPGGRVARGIGGVKLGMKRKRARAALGLPSTESTRWMTWCFDGGGNLYAAFTGRGAQLVLTNSAPFDTHAIRTGHPATGGVAAAPRERRFGRVRGAAVYGVRERHRRLLVGVRRGRVAYLAVRGGSCRAGGRCGCSGRCLRARAAPNGSIKGSGTGPAANIVHLPVLGHGRSLVVVATVGSVVAIERRRWWLGNGWVGGGF